MQKRGNREPEEETKKKKEYPGKICNQKYERQGSDTQEGCNYMDIDNLERTISNQEA